MAGYDGARYRGWTTGGYSIMMGTVIVVIMHTTIIIVVVVGIGISVATVTGCNVIVEGIVNRFRWRSFGGIPAAMSWAMRCINTCSARTYASHLYAIMMMMLMMMGIGTAWRQGMTMSYMMMMMPHLLGMMSRSSMMDMHLTSRRHTQILFVKGMMIRTICGSRIRIARVLIICVMSCGSSTCRRHRTGGGCCCRIAGGLGIMT
ncbi:hypothetical protein GQX74_003264 [Glossina fuscipes]|nr:hypothetical protein GQX74_003264 [Glossina fuscipes]